MENPENSRSALIVPLIVDRAFAEEVPTGYVYLKGNFTATGGIESLVVDGAKWNGWVDDEPDDGVQTFSGSDTVTIGNPVILVPETAVPADGLCWDAADDDFTTTPTTLLCAVGSPTVVTDNGTGSTYTWGCSGVNEGDPTPANSCIANHVPVSCIFDESNFDECTFAP